MAAPPLGPGDLQGVFDCLRGCLSQDASVQKQAEAALTALGVRPGFCSCLAEIMMSRDVADHSARWLAAVHFKNTVTKFWRSRAPGALSEEEKAHLRGRLLPLLDQEDSQIAVQAAVVLAKVARLDFPRAWPSLFSDLLGRLQAASGAGSTGTLTARRCYLALHHILKELSTKRLAADQRVFGDVAAQLLDPLWAQWAADTTVLVNELPGALAGGPSGPGGALAAVLLVFERWLLQLKALRRLLLFGFPSDSRTMEPVAAVEQAAPAMLQTLRTLLGLAAAGAGGPASVSRAQAAAMLGRGCLKLVKTLRQLAETHPWSVLRCGALVSALDTCCEEAAAPSVRAGAPAAALSRQCLQFLHSAARCAAYRGSPAALSLSAGKGREQMDRLKAAAAEAAPVLRAFWSARQGPLVELIIIRLFPLNDRELELWEDSGEEFHAEAEHGAWEESSRGCGERLLTALLESDRDALAPAVVDLLRRAAEGAIPPPPPGAGFTDSPVPWLVRAKAAAYHALAVGAYELHDAVDFPAWLHGSLLGEAADTSATMRPLRRAAIKLFAAWAAKLRREDRPLVYRALITALADPDPAIHLAAAAALHALVDDWEFEEAAFAEFVAPCFQLLASLLQNSAELEAQLDLFALINLIVDRLGDGSAAHAPGLLALLPSVWEGGEGQSLLRIQVLLCLQRLVHALGASSPAAYPVLLPVLAAATHPDQPDELNLLEDALLLWLVALHHAPAPAPGLLAPLPHLLSAMEKSTEHVAVGSRLLSAAVLLAGPGPNNEALAAHGTHIAAVLATLLGSVNERGVLHLLPVLDVIIQLAPAEGPALMAPALQTLLAQAVAGSQPSTVSAQSLGVLARVLLHNPGAFLALFQAAGPTVAATLPPDAAPDAAGADPAHRLLLATVDMWVDKFDALALPPARKLAAMALAALLAAPVPGVLSRAPGVAACVTSVWFELEGPDAGPEKAGADYLAAWAAPRLDDLPLAVNLADAEGDENRRRVLFDAGPVATARLSGWVKQQMEAAAGAHGGAALNAALNALDPALGAQLKQMLDAAG